MHPLLKVTAALSDLSNLIPLGTIDVNIEGLPGPAPAAPDGWLWAPPLPWVAPKEKSALAVFRLCHWLYLRATYLSVGNGRARLRIYGVPKDVNALIVYDEQNRPNAQRDLKAVFRLIDTTSASWYNYKSTPDLTSSVSDQPTSLSLREIYSKLPSPEPYALPFSKYSTLFEDVLAGNILGLTSTLFLYQRETVWKMLQQELLPQSRTDPRLVKKASPDGSIYYINSEETELWKTPQDFLDSRGGILCEEMGSGKTCICLALILCTLSQFSEVPLGYAATIPSSKASRSLVDHCVGTIAKNGVAWKDSLVQPALIDKIRLNPVSYTIWREKKGTRGENNERSVSADIYLSATTLVVVPDNLVTQWTLELSKHVAPEALDVKVINSSNPNIPPPEQLIRFDLVIISQSRFAREDEQGGLDCYRGVRLKCRCPYVGASRTVKCRCRSAVLRGPSPLIRIHWKRVIVDEGHSLGAKGTRLIRLASKLFVERRWCATGTPTEKLTSVELGMPTDFKPSWRDDSNAAQNDLRRLGAIVIDFLKLEPFTQSLWTKTIIRPYRHFQTAELDRIMSMMIRHRAFEIEKSVLLPPLIQRRIILEPTPYNRLSINTIIALIASNAVQSQRTDQDYLFHPSQLKNLRETVRNLMLSTFSWTGTAVQDLQQAIQHARDGLERGISKGKYSNEDFILLENAIVQMETAISDPVWRQLAVRSNSESGQEMGYLMTVEEEIDDAWAIYTENGYSLYSGASLVSMQQSLRKNNGVDEAAQIRNLVCAAKSPKSPLKSPVKITDEEQQKVRKVLQHSSSTLPQQAISPDNPLCRLRIMSTISSKLNYLIAQVLKYHESEKIIIFAEHSAVIWYISEALEILGIEYLIYIPQLVSLFAVYESNLRILNVNPSTSSRSLHLKQFAY